jgi:hypothetical protein
LGRNFLACFIVTVSPQRQYRQLLSSLVQLSRKYLSLNNEERVLINKLLVIIYDNIVMELWTRVGGKKSRQSIHPVTDLTPGISASIKLESNRDFRGWRLFLCRRYHPN